MKNKYSANIYWSNDDECFVALIPGFSGLAAFGETKEEAAREIQVALELMLEGLQEEGIAPPEPRLLPEHSGQLRIRIPKSLHTDLAIEAERQGVSLNTHITSLLAREQGEFLAFRKIERKIDRIESTCFAICKDLLGIQEKHDALVWKISITGGTKPWPEVEQAGVKPVWSQNNMQQRH